MKELGIPGTEEFGDKKGLEDGGIREMENFVSGEMG